MLPLWWPGVERIVVSVQSVFVHIIICYESNTIMQSCKHANFECIEVHANSIVVQYMPITCTRAIY